jgi:chaperonin cofactor prefoldin
MLITKEKVKKDIEERLESYKAELEALKKVTFNVKKDGEPFQNLSKCFNDARYGFSPYDEKHTHPQLTVTFVTPKGYIQSSSISCRALDNTLLSFEEIKAAINHRIEFVELAIEGCNDDLKEISTRLDEADKEIIKIKDIIGRCKECQEQINDYITDKVRFAYTELSRCHGIRKKVGNELF